MYEASDLFAEFLDAKGQAEYEKWREENTHLWDKAVNKYYEIEGAEAREKYLFTLAPRVRQYVIYMVEEDWKLDLGPNAQRVQQMSGQRTGGGGMPPIPGGGGGGMPPIPGGGGIPTIPGGGGGSREMPPIPVGR